MTVKLFSFAFVLTIISCSSGERHYPETEVHYKHKVDSFLFGPPKNTLVEGQLMDDILEVGHRYKGKYTATSVQLLTSGGSFGHEYLATINGVHYEFCNDRHGLVNFISCSDPKFSANGIAVGSTYKDVKRILVDTYISKEWGWAKYAHLPSGWNAAFDVPYDHDDNVKVLWFFKRLGAGMSSKNWAGVTGKREWDTISDKQVKYYTSNPKCALMAINFYDDKFWPGDNDSTETLLSLATSNDNNLRPFYRWCLDKTIFMADGAVMEYTGIPARRYAEKFPKEFFEFMDKSGSYNKWVASIAYSGFYDEDDLKKPQEIRVRMASNMKHNCVYCDESTLHRIDKFANDCFQ